MDLVLEQIDHYGPGTGTLVLIQWYWYWYWYIDTEHEPGTGTLVLEDSDNEPGTGERRQGRIPLSSLPSGKTAFLSGERFILVLSVQEKVHIIIINYHHHHRCCCYHHQHQPHQHILVPVHCL